MSTRGLPWLRKLVYFPTQEVPPIERLLPRGQEVSFTTEDGLRLSAWFLPGSSEASPSVLVLPGNGGNRADRAALASALAAHGYGVLLCDYRGYGGNPGRPSEEGLAADARAAHAWLARERAAGSADLVVFGESLGAAVAVRLASEVASGALVLRSPFTSLHEIARHHYRVVPAAVLPDRFPSIELIGGVRCPTMVIVGAGDRIVPPAQSERLYEAAREPKRLLTLARADHNDLVLLAGAAMVNPLVEFVETHLDLAGRV